MKKAAALVFLCFLIAALLAGCGKSEKVITKFEDASEAKIGVMTGTIGEQIALDRFPNADVKSFDDIMDAVAALKSGQLEAVITTYPTAMNVAKHNPEIWYLPEPLQNEDTAIAVKKGNDVLLAEVDNIITELKKDGTLADMKKRWFKEDLSPYEEADLAVPTEGEVLKIGVSATREPFSFTAENGRITGHDGELARRIGIKLGRPVEFSDMKFSALLPALQSGKIDLIITGMTASEERKKSVNFTQPYFTNAQVLMVKKAPGATAGSTKMASLDDINGKKVAVYTGTIHDAFVASHYPQAEILRFDSTADMVLSLKNRKGDVALLDLISAKVLLKSNPELGILTDDVLTKPLGIGFNKNNPALRDKFNSYLKQAKADGTYAEMYRRWCEDDPEKAEMPELKSPETGEEIILGVAVADLPYVANMNGAYVGFDIEMLQRFAQHEGIRLKIMTMEFSSLVAALASGKVDMIADGIAITEERQKQIDFSDPYMDFKTAAIALKENIAAYGDQDTAQAETTFFQSIGNSFYNNMILENRYLLILDGLKTTVVISILATVFGTLLGALICFMRMSRKKVLKQLAKIYISILRGTPVLVLLMLIFYVVFAAVDIDPILVAVVAFGMNFAAYVSEMYRTGIEGVDKGQTEAGIAMGFTQVKTFLYIVLPQAVRKILPVYKGEFISLVKMTSVVGYIAVQDLTKASDIIRSRTFDAFFPLVMVAVLYFFISWLLALSLEFVEKSTDPKVRRKQVKSV
ncbi:ABC transporter permease subunit [Candidatus Formimonas warabiya]|uniref:Amino acid ABC transporter n=1 Tax=Formimonas warabiya TaxID=1761012 RepID=A0A3G1KZK4_FORW1|nr:ABC transporter permease subunit [Candidatus Formimonas warabiya]ATW27840.1 amino acid ABC transporter [Candidatus Formimonas warabiya]